MTTGHVLGIYGILITIAYVLDFRAWWVLALILVWDVYKLLTEEE